MNNEFTQASTSFELRKQTDKEQTNSAYEMYLIYVKTVC